MNWTISRAGQAIRQGRLSPVELLDDCLGRIDALEERVRAWVLVDGDRARAEARARQEELARGQDRGPLHGIPVGIKDIIDVFDWPTACGSQRWAASYARQDAPVVRRLRQAGAVLIGKTATTPYASFDPAPTRNPWDLTRTPGGSSSGSAAAVACGMCLGALASQTGGSITRPASYCGVPASKPTYGAAPAEGVLPLAPSMDHVGTMARCVRDVALLMQTIADPPAADWLTPLAGPLALPTLGRPRGFFDRLASAEVRDFMDRVCAQLCEGGATIREVALPASFAEVVARHRVVMAVEAAAYHGARLRRYPDDYPPHIRGLIEEGLACPAPEYACAREHQQLLGREMAALLAEYDGLICPATTTPAPDAATTGDPAFNSPWSFTGLPVVSVPAALSREGLPLAVQLVGAARQEGKLFATAAWCEDTLGFNPGRPPVRP
jgi:aspartyl-tRNA(Asn)/glutamyl-tRNA(Gln) amidotransferase subunit A